MHASCFVIDLSVGFGVLSFNVRGVDDLEIGSLPVCAFIRFHLFFIEGVVVDDRNMYRKLASA